MDIRSAAEQVLRNAEHYLDHIDQDVYNRPLDLLFGASIGAHTRHFIEFYTCLLDQLNGEDPVVDYSGRRRDERIENDPAIAAQAIVQLSEQIRSLNLDQSCRLRCSEHVKNTESYVESNARRELLYNIEHTIHHLAIIKIGLAAIAPQIELPAHFGVAPSTIEYKQGACAQ